MGCKSFTIISLMLLSNLAGAADKCGSLERMETAIRLVRTLYPELRDTELSIGLAEGSYAGGARPVDARAFEMKIGNPEWHPPNQDRKDEQPEGSTTTAQAQQQRREVPLLLTFNFIDFGRGRHKVECHPVQFLNNRPTKMLEDAQAEINAHPAWTQAEALEAAKRHGLRFGPSDKQAVLKLIPLRELSTFFGTLRVKRTKFTVTSEHEKDAAYSFALLSWVITAEEVGTTRALEISVEPFQGAIVGLSEGDKRDLLQ
jgi:hypothetical protein